jgi:putative PIN family toxin of toxin-antitoxin system
VIELLIRVVIDTNIWISALINPSGPPAKLIQAILSGQVQLVLSAPLLAEVHDVVRRERIRRRISMDDRALDDFLNAMRDGAIITTIDGTLRLCRDSKDDLVVETAIAGGARYIVSRDEDLTRDLDLVDALREYSIDVLTVARFLELLDNQPS